MVVVFVLMLGLVALPFNRVVAQAQKDDGSFLKEVLFGTVTSMVAGALGQWVGKSLEHLNLVDGEKPIHSPVERHSHWIEMRLGNRIEIHVCDTIAMHLS
jgi:uncharacterized membrane protein YeaQ/YmgE (transglycosylase-associated protein family)